MGKKNATFADLAELVKNNASQNTAFKYLSVAATNLTNDPTDIFNHETTPNLSIAEAVRISSTFPGIFKAMERKHDQSVDLYVDAGLKNNLPANVFNDEKYFLDGYKYNKKGVNPLTLCIKIDTAEEVIRVWEKYHSKQIRNLKEFGKAIVLNLLSRDQEIHQLYGTNVITVFDGNVNTLKFDLNEKEKLKLIKLGRQAALDYLQSHLSEAYKIKTFKDELSWISSKKTEEIADILDYYQNKFADTNTTQDKKTLLNEKINWLKDYLKFRYEKIINPQTVYSLPAPSPHIDIHVPIPRKQMDEKIRADLKFKRNVVDAQLAVLNLTHENLESKIKPSNNLHSSNTYHQIVSLTKVKENLKSLTDFKHDFQNKLAIKNPPISPNQYLGALQEFENAIRSDLLEKPDSPQSKFMNHINNHCYYRLVCWNDVDNDNLTLNFQNENEMKIYIMTCMLYLKSFNLYPVLQEKLKDCYEKCFNTPSLPTDLNQLGIQLKQADIPLMSTVYKIESLMRFFINIDKPEYRFNLNNIDQVFLSLSKNQNLSFSRKYNSKQNEGEDDFFKSSIFRLNDNFLMFYQPIGLSAEKIKLEQKKRFAHNK